MLMPSSPSASPPRDGVSEEQHARLLELEERQRRLKRLCEEAMKAEEEKHRILQQLEDHQKGLLSVGSFADVSTARRSEVADAFGRAAVSASAAPLDDPLTGEVQSFRDPNSIARASSTSSVVAAPGRRSGSRSSVRYASLERPRTRYDRDYLPPPPLPHPESSLGLSKPPTGARAMLYGNARPSRAEATVVSATTTTTSTAFILNSWWTDPRDESRGPTTTTSPLSPLQRIRSDEPSTRTAEASRILSAAAMKTSRAPPPPPPPENMHDGDVGRSVPTTDVTPAGRSVHRQGALAPPPPSSSPPSSATYLRPRRAAAGLAPPSAVPLSPPPPSSHVLLSPDEVTDSLPPPPPHVLHRPVTSLATPYGNLYGGTGDTGRRYRRVAILDSPMPPPPPLRDDDGNDGEGVTNNASLHSSSTAEEAILRWRRQLRPGGLHRGSGTARWSEGARATRRRHGGATPHLSPPHRETGVGKSSSYGRRAVQIPPPSPPSSLFSGLSSPALDDGAEADKPLVDRWETVSLTPSLRSAEERHLRRYFSDIKMGDGSAAPAPPSPSRWSSTFHDVEQPWAREAWDPLASHAQQPYPATRKAAEPRRMTALSDPVAAHPPAPSSERVSSKSKVVVHPYGKEHPRLATTAAPPILTQGATSQRSASVGLNSSRHSVWGDDSTAGPTLFSVGGRTSAPPPSGSTNGVSADHYFDVGPEKEALLSLVRASVHPTLAAHTGGAVPRSSPATSVQPAVARQPTAAAAAAAAADDSTNLQRNERRGPNGAEIAAHSFHLPIPPKATSPPAAGVQSSCSNEALPSRSYWSSVRETSPAPREEAVRSLDAAPSNEQDGDLRAMRQMCQEAQSKAEALARHLVKAITDRKMLQGTVEQLEELVEECNMEVGRLQKVVEEQHHGSSTSLGVQAALRVKEHEVAVYENEIRRLNGVLDGHLSRTANAAQALHDGTHHRLMTKETEVETALAEVGIAHLAQREAEERANQLANELETAVEQIQYLDGRLAEMERAAAAVSLQRANLCLAGGAASEVGKVTAGALSAVALAVPSEEETQHWPLEARRVLTQLVGQVEQLLQQNAEGARHATTRLQYVEHTCSELQQTLSERDEEMECVQQACTQLRQQNMALQTCGEQWYQQLQGVKIDAQLVSEMMRTAREDAEDVYLSSRLAKERLAEQHAAAAAASPFQPYPVVSATDPAMLSKAASFAQQVMRDFHAVARFLTSLRSMDIGDRNAYQILESLAGGHSPPVGLYVTGDDAATPMRISERLEPNVASEVRRRVRKKKARVLQAVEKALAVETEPSQGTMYPHGDSDNDGYGDATALDRDIPTSTGRHPPHGERQPVHPSAVAATAEEEFCHIPDAFEDDFVDLAEAAIEVSTALQPVQSEQHHVRGNSCGLVNSGVRPRRESGSVSSLPRFSASQRLPAAPRDSAASSAFTPPLTATVAPSGSVPPCTTEELLPPRLPAARVTPAPALYTPSPSVARPLRLSTTPSLPQAETGENEALVPESIGPGSPTEASQTVIATPLRDFGRRVSGVEVCSATSISSVPSSPEPPQPQQQQAVPPLHTTEPGGSPGNASLAGDAEEGTGHPGPVRLDAGLPDDRGQGAEWNAPPDTASSPSTEKPTWSRLSSASSRLRSPTPDSVLRTRRGPNTGLLTSPSQDSPPLPYTRAASQPRAARQEASPSLPVSAHPKDRSVTARPSSTPHAESPTKAHRTASTTGIPRLHGKRDGNAPSGESDDDGEAILLYREPPHGVVQEVTTNGALPSQEGPCRKDNPTENEARKSRKPETGDAHSETCGATAAAAPRDYAEPLPKDDALSLPHDERASSAAPTAETPEDVSMIEEEADLIERPLHTPAVAVPSLLGGDARGTTHEVPRASQVRHHRSNEDDDDAEPSLHFSTPAEPAASTPVTIPTRHSGASVTDVTTSRGSSAAVPLMPHQHASAMGNRSAAPVSVDEHLPRSTLAPGSSAAGVSHHLQHQPRRLSPANASLSLPMAVDAMMPPRLQRSTSASASASSPLASSTNGVPSTAAVQSAFTATRSSRSGSLHPSPGSSLDRPPPESTPPLAEPQRSESVRTTAPTTVTASTPAHGGGGPTEFQSVATRPTARAPQDGELCGARTPTGAVNEIVIRISDEDLLRSSSRRSGNTSSSTPMGRLPSVASTAAPGSPSDDLADEPSPPPISGVLAEALNRNDDNVSPTSPTSVSQPADPPQAVSEQPRKLPMRAGAVAVRHPGIREGDAPAPLPAVNIDTFESNTLGLPRASASPQTTVAEVTAGDGAATPRRGGTTDDLVRMGDVAPMDAPLSDEATVRRREEIAKILERIRAKKEQDRALRPDDGTPLSPTLSGASSSAHVEDDRSPSL